MSESVARIILGAINTIVSVGVFALGCWILDAEFPTWAIALIAALALTERMG